MEKLVNKFGNIIDPIDYGNQFDKSKECAEECKRVAIEFAEFNINYYADIHNPIITNQEMFKRFIEEEYK
jgi:hypothetical protein